jgi:hypothetical protein
MSITIKKDLIEQYTLRQEFPRLWATISISKEGCLSIQSCFGDYCNTWSSFRESFKQFLISVDKFYLAKKIAYEKTQMIDFQKTFIQIKKDILKSRRNREINAEEAKEMLQLIAHEIRHGSCCKSDEFERLIISRYADIVKKVYDNDCFNVPVIRTFDSSLDMFLNLIWPEFVKILKNEIYSL